MAKKDGVYLGEMEAGESLTARMRAVEEAVRERFPNVPNVNTWAYPKEVFDDAVVVSYESGGRSRIYALSYTMKDGKVTLGEEMVELTEAKHYELKKRGSMAALKVYARKKKNAPAA